jgi:predicted flap endonuclease-1-like 5' DNA nuclease
MRDRPRDKMRGPGRNKGVDDFTEIPGVPAFASESLHNQGVLRFDQLWTADVGWLPWPVRDAIARWRGG